MEVQQLERLNMRYHLHLLKNEKEAALEVIDVILQETPSALLYTLRGEILSDLQQNTIAANSFHKALEIDGGLKETHEALERIKSQDVLPEAPTVAEERQNSRNFSQQATATIEMDNDSDFSEEITVAEKTPQDSSSGLDTLVDLEENETVRSLKTSPGKGITQSKVTTVGSSFSRYKILSTLGKGGMGVVYKARDSELDRDIALKVIINQENVSQNQLSRFIQEVKTTARLKHPHIISIYDFGVSPQHYFTMEYIEGKTLSQLIKEDSLKMKDIAQTMVAICSAMVCAHENKIIHRDLKPSNIMMDANGKPKVMDFGLAKLLESQSSLSKTGDLLGTPVYMPPEQANGGNVDEKSDIYSLGAIGYEMLTQRPPFQGENIYNILHQVSSVDPIPPKTLNPDIALDLQTIFLKCLEKSPSRRYESVKELQDDLERYLNNKPIRATPPTYAALCHKWLLRNKGFAAAITTITLLIVASLIIVTSLYLREKNRTQAQNIVNEAVEWFQNRKNMSMQFIEKKFTEAKQASPDYFATHQRLGIIYFQYANNPRTPLFRVKDTSLYKSFKNGSSDKDIQKIFTKNGYPLNTDSHFQQDTNSYTIAKSVKEKGTKYYDYIIEEDNQIKYRLKNDGNYLSIYRLNCKEEYYRKAIKELDLAISYNPGDYISMYQLYLIYGTSLFKDYDKALFYIKKLMSFDPPLENEYGYFSRGKIVWLKAMEAKDLKRQKELLEETKRLYDKAAEYNGNFTCLNRFRGVAYLTSKDYDRAIHCFKSAIEIDPDLPDTYFDLACLYAWQKDQKNALKYLELALQKGFRDFEALYKNNIIWKLVRKIERRQEEVVLWDFVRNTEGYKRLVREYQLPTKVEAKSHK